MRRKVRAYLHEVVWTEGELAVGLVAGIRGYFHVASGKWIVLFGGRECAVHPTNHGELLRERGNGLRESERIERTFSKTERGTRSILLRTRIMTFSGISSAMAFSTEKQREFL